MTYNTWTIDITFGAKGTNPTYKAQKGDTTEEGELTFSEQQNKNQSGDYYHRFFILVIFFLSLHRSEP